MNLSSKMGYNMDERTVRKIMDHFELVSEYAPPPATSPRPSPSWSRALRKGINRYIVWWLKYGKILTCQVGYK